MITFSLPPDLFEALLQILFDDSRKSRHVRVSDELIAWLTDQIDHQIF